ncbi:hypothetical protein Tdes44962_MAKER08734 [Teratosphaeria destructans]|uniref:Uncharacterized protein n=1 Tax=Teratosphaeria destructans TaxID=418781 RepID=A0A9W7SW25_9PEZI|nr:hypothetical protein Tdes44962_MAKER08734 [Teratosphaeria destructans]
MASRLHILDWNYSTEEREHFRLSPDHLSRFNLLAKACREEAGDNNLVAYLCTVQKSRKGITDSGPASVPTNDAQEDSDGFVDLASGRYRMIDESNSKMSPKETLEVTSLSMPDGQKSLNVQVSDHYNCTHTRSLEDISGPDKQKLEIGIGPGRTDLISHLYIKTAILVIPSRYLEDFVAGKLPRDYQTNDKMHYRIMLELNALQASAANEKGPHARLKRFCRHVGMEFRKYLRNERSKPYDTMVYTAVVRGAIVLANADGLRTFARQRLCDLGESVEQLLDSINKRSFVEMRDCANALINSNHGDECYQHLLTLVTRHTLTKEDDRRALEQWACKKVTRLVAEDGRIDWLGVASKSESAKILAARLLPGYTPKDNLTFEGVIGFGNTLLNGLRFLPIERSVAMTAFRRVAQKEVNGFRSPCKEDLWRCSCCRKLTYARQNSEDQRASRAVTKKIEDLSQLHRILHLLGMESDAQTLRVHTEKQLEDDINGLEFFILPFLQDFFKHVGDTQLSTDFKAFVTRVLERYLREYVQQQPQEPKMLIEKCGCGCSDCEQMDSFLAHRAWKRTNFALAKDRRKHLELKLHRQALGKLIDVQTRSSGNPHVLIVEKINHEAEYFQWHNRMEIAWRVVHDLGNEAQIRHILGDKWKAIMRFGMVRSSAGRTVPLNRISDYMQLAHEEQQTRQWLMTWFEEGSSPMSNQQLWDIFGRSRTEEIDVPAIPWDSFWPCVQSTFPSSTIEDASDENKWINIGIRLREQGRPTGAPLPQAGTRTFLRPTVPTSLSGNTQPLQPAEDQSRNLGTSAPDDNTRVSKLETDIKALHAIADESARLCAWIRLIWQDYKRSFAVSGKFETQVAAGAMLVFVPKAVEGVSSAMRNRSDGTWEFVFEGMAPTEDYVALRRAGLEAVGQNSLPRTRAPGAVATSPMRLPRSSSDMPVADPISAIGQTPIESTRELSCKERAVAWLRERYTPDVHSEVSQMSIWTAFRADFKDDAATLACLNAAALLDWTTHTLQGASTEQIEDRYVVRGIRQRVASHAEGRAAAWLRANYVSNASSEVPQSNLYNAFREAFKDDERMLAFTSERELVQLVEKTFDGITKDWIGIYLLKGIERRDAPALDVPVARPPLAMLSSNSQVVNARTSGSHVGDKRGLSGDYAPRLPSKRVCQVIELTDSEEDD